jgi:large conductance mechanosensitive channel
MTSRILNEFKEFISRGNVIDLALGVIIGAAFGKIVNSLVNDIIMPPIGILLKGISFKDFFLPLDGHHYESLEAAQKAGIAIINYGNFITVSIEFIIVAFSIFAMVKTINMLKKNAVTAFATAPTKTELLLAEIRDEFKKHSSPLKKDEQIKDLTQGTP